jgi:outer membrane protein TolC
MVFATKLGYPSVKPRTPDDEAQHLALARTMLARGETTELCVQVIQARMHRTEQQAQEAKQHAQRLMVRRAVHTGTAIPMPAPDAGRDAGE